ncbi:MAG: glycosyl hydrolase, partial [Candidatus Nanopelagicales bacterium]
MSALRTRIVALAAAIGMVATVGMTAAPSQAVTSAAAPATLAATAPMLAPAKKKSAKKQSPSKRSTHCSKLSGKQRNALKKQLRTKRLTAKHCSAKVRAMKAAKKSKPKPAPAPAPAPAPTPTPTPTPAPQTSPTTVFGLSANGEAALAQAEAKIGLTAGVVGVFTDFKRPFPTADANAAAARGAALLISWEPWDWEVKSQNQSTYSLDRITDGDHDAYIRQFARDAAATGKPVFVRFAAEMNGDWHVWSTGFNGNGPGDYAAAYRHVVDLSRAEGAHNIKWMFNPIVSYEGSTPLTSLYPGDAYVDWVALDGYNWGPLKWGWQSFDDIFTMGLAEIKAVAPGKPLGIAEIGSTPGIEKAAWVTDTFAKAHANGVRMFVWFEHNKETDWRLSADPQVAAAAKAAAT